MDPAEESSGPSKSKQPIVGRLGVLQPAISPENEHAGAGVASAARKPARTGLEDGEKGISLSKLPKKRGGLPKRDRSTLRKGKWTVRLGLNVD